MRTVCTFLTLVAALLVAGNLLAGERKAGGKKEQRAQKAQKAQKAEWKVPEWLAKLNLTDEQKKKIKAVDDELAPQRAEIAKKTQGLLTEEQKKARAEVQKKIKAEGKKGQEAKEMVDAALKLTDEQKAKMAEVAKERASLMNELREKVKTILTDEQKEQLKKARPKHERRGAKKAKQS